MYYQGSYQSTDEGIEKAFNLARNNSEKEKLHVLFFDEIGMAELNPKNPLKVLHKLLDDAHLYNFDESAESSTAKKEKLFDLKNFNFISLSNWRLDLSKMSRSIYLTRPDLSIDDLLETADDLMTFGFDERRMLTNHEHNSKYQKKIRKIIEEEKENMSQTYHFFRKNIFKVGRQKIYF